MFFIVNPVAGSGKCNALFSECETILRERGIEFIVKKTEYKGHAVKIAEDAIKNGEKFIIAAGGDGTVNEISSVICQNPNVKLGILPFGTGNDLSGVMNLPSEPEAAIDLLLSGEAKYIDMGIANGTKFTNVCGIGFDVDVLINTERHKKGRKGMLPYFLGIVDSLFHRKKVHAKIKTDSIQYEGDIIISVAGNGKRFGGGMLVNPDAEVDDGLFDLCIVRWVSLFTFLRLLPLFIKGKHKNKAPVTNIRTQSFTIETDSECIVELDGELIEKTPFVLGVILLAVFSAAFIADFTVTLTALVKLPKKLKAMAEAERALRAVSDKIGENISDTTIAAKEKGEALAEENKPRLEELKAEYEKKKKELSAMLERNFVQRRIFKAFPNLKNGRYKAIFDRISELKLKVTEKGNEKDGV